MQKAPLTPFFLTMVILGTILSIRNWPFLVEYGFSSSIYLLTAAFVFFIPVSLVSAEMASGWPEKGGLYVWVKEALGRNAAFLSIWFLWISNAVWYPTILSFIASTAFYSFAPSLANDPFYVMLLMLSLFWGVLISNLLGIRYSAWFGTIAFLLGTLLPGMLLIFFGGLWLTQGQFSHIDFSLSALIPPKTHLNELIFLVSMVLSFAGMEMNAIHARDVENPKKNFPKAIFLSALIIVLLTMMGIFAIGIVIPKEKVNLATAVMEAAAYYLENYHLSGMLPFFSLMISMGALGCVSSWIVGTSKGLFFASENEALPKSLFRLNRHGVPVFLMFTQGVIVSLLAFLFVTMPNLNSVFWILTALSSQLYLITYILLFISGCLLRLKKPSVPREYAIPFGKIGIFTVSGIGLTSSIFAFVIGFIPPAQIQVKNALLYKLFLMLGIALCSLIPYLLLRKKNSSSAFAENG